MRNQHRTRFARQLRRTMTDADHRLWFHLRNRALVGAKSRRQHPVGPYIVVFACLEARMAIELDGGQHGAARDAPREAFLAAGYRVLGFWNNDALVQTDAVLAVLVDALSRTVWLDRGSPQGNTGGHRP